MSLLRSKAVQRLLRWLIALLGAGLGVALLLGVGELLRLVRPEWQLSFTTLLIVYMGTAVLFGGLFYLLGQRIIELCVAGGNDLEKRLDRMPFAQVLSSTGGLIAGLMIAALVSQIFNFMGQSLFTTVLSTIVYVVLGVCGLTIGKKRAGDLSALMERVPGRLNRRHRKAEEEPRMRPKLLDTSLLIDGRILEMCRVGFVEGELVVPSFVLADLMRVADSADAVKRSRGRRGLDILEKLQAEGKQRLRMDETDYEDLTGTDVKLLHLSQETEAVILTCDSSLQKAATVAGVPAWNLNELASALRTSVVQGEELTVQIVKEGKEPGQGVAYLSDGTMIVVDGGRRMLGESAEIVVGNVVQTSAGRMIFAKVK